MSSLRDRIEAELARVFFAPRIDGLAKDQAAAVMKVLSAASPRELRFDERR